MAPYEYKVTCQAAGHPGTVYHVRVWLRLTLSEENPDHWTMVFERQVDAGNFPGEPRKQWRNIMAQLKV